MKFTDIFIKRPVLATVVSLLIFFFGLRAIDELTVREYPKMSNTLITITTTYPGASADVMQGFITSIIEQAVATTEGIDYMTGQSTQGQSVIQVYVKLNYDPNAAFTDVMAAVSSVQNQLPPDSQLPVITKSTGSPVALMYLGFNSVSMSPQQITEYIARVIQPNIQAISGVSSAQILGPNTYAMRIWLDPKRMAAMQVDPTAVYNAIAQNNYQSAPGGTKGEYVGYPIYAYTDLTDVAGFADMVVRDSNGVLVRMKDIATVELGSQSYNSSVSLNGIPAIFVAINGTPTANPLSVISQVRQLLPVLEKKFPPTLNAYIAYDSTEYIKAALYDVIRSIGEATIIVIIVIFLFLGALRSVVIPVVTIPLSLVGVCSFMLALGYSINILTLLAMVLAIGLVVDDAIVVVENIYRHIEEGMSPFDAAITGAREIALPIVAMTITLASVYAPIGFMSGLTGSLFKEFAFTLASSVIISGIIALTLSPMMCSKVLSAELSEGKFVKFLDRNFDRLKNAYQRRLHAVLNYRPVVVVFAITVLSSCYFLYSNTQSELAPEEDQSVLFVQGTGPDYANIDYMEVFTNEYNKIFKGLPETEDYFVVNGGGSAVNTAIAGVILKPWDQRKRSQQELNPILQEYMRTRVPGLQSVVFPLPSLPVSGSGLPVQFVINSTADFPEIFTVSQEITDAARKSGMFLFVDNSLKFDNPRVDVHIDRFKAAQLGLNMQSIGGALATSLGGNYVNFFGMDGKSYQVIPQVERIARLTPEKISDINVQTSSGNMVPLSTVVDLTHSVQPNSVTQFQQLNSTTISAILAPGRTLGEALNFLQSQADKTLPKYMTTDYAGESRQFIQEGSALIYTFFFAIIVIYLVLAAQFESFRDPFIILVSVPMSICGALIPLNLGLATINIYTQIGLITLIGLISKHGILMVEFANKLQQHEGISIREAIEKAASIRLRPILMTTAAMILGVIPLMLATGAGSHSRFDIGLVISTGMAIGTLFTLFVVPTMYTFFAKDHTQLYHENQQGDANQLKTD